MENIINLSIVIPAFNEAKNLEVLINRLIVAVNKLEVEYEIIIVDDGSTDNSAKILQNLCLDNKRLKILFLSKNFGHQAALNAGLDNSIGEAVITMDADLQHPPELVGQMYNEFKNGYDLVLGERLSNIKISKIRKGSSDLFYIIFNKLSESKIQANVADFNLYSRAVVNVLKQMPEKDRFLRGLVQWIGFNKKYFQYQADNRLDGESKYSLKKMVELALSGITSFSASPLRVAWWIGLAVAIGDFIYGVYIIFQYLFFRSSLITGWASLIIVILFVSGVQLMILGIMGEYLSKIFYEIKGRPLYIVKRSIGINNSISNNKTKYGIGA